MNGAHSPSAFDLVVFDWEGTLALARPAAGGDDTVPGLAGLLEDLHALGVPLAIATGKSRRGLDAALAARRWHGLFAQTRSADDGPGKPHPWMLHDLCAVLDVDPARAVMVGDTVHDAGMARAAGAVAVGVGWGLQDPAALRGAGASAVVASVEALAAWLWPRLAAAARGLEAGLSWRPVCASASLTQGGDGVRFTWPRWPAHAGARVLDEPAFAVRHGVGVRAYLNRCAHAPVEMDWPAGRFFDDSGLYLVCASHGATYRPEDGVCVAGPCRGKRLQPLAVRESAGRVWVAFQNGPDHSEP